MVYKPADFSSLLTYCSGALYESLLEADVDGLYADIVRQLLSTVLRLDDEEIPHDVELKELCGEQH